MGETGLEEQLAHGEALLLEGMDDEAWDLLARLAEDAEQYVAANCETTSEVQWFSFPTPFERLAYRRVERDPRELRDVGEPLDRLYADYALASLRTGRDDVAAGALRQAVRWNPMGCEHRLNLADLSLAAGDVEEFLGLSYSVFERASDARHLARAYSNFSGYFLSIENPRAAAACLRAGERFDAHESALAQSLEEAAGTDHDPALLGDDEMGAVLAQEGLPDGANAEIAICLLMCATDAADAGGRNLATSLVVRARDLVGEKASMALLALIRESDGDISVPQDGQEGGA